MSERFMLELINFLDRNVINHDLRDKLDALPTEEKWDILIQISFGLVNKVANYTNYIKEHKDEFIQKIKKTLF